MTAPRSVLTEPFDATKRQADPILRADTVFRLECGDLALACSEHVGTGQHDGRPSR